jgi:diguanylate cyclase (GGDEF)-like protein
MENNFELTYSMKYRATHDPLVGLFNRSELEYQFEQRKIHSSHGLAMMFVDLDNFKPLNDTFGHEAGDDALIAVAQILKTRIRNDDIAARLGGDEFVVLLYLDDANFAQRIADDIRTGVESIVNKDKRFVGLSCSIGLAFKADDNIGFSAMLRQADIACYESKSSGKNNVSLRLV